MTAPALRYVPATNADGLPFQGLVYRRANGRAETDELVDARSGFPSRKAALRWARARIVELGEPS